jgi:hypothetical protein
VAPCQKRRDVQVAEIVSSVRMSLTERFSARSAAGVSFPWNGWLLMGSHGYLSPSIVGL